MKPEIEVERRAGMITGASCGHTSLTWLPSAGEIGCLAGILQTIANKGGRDDEPVG